MKSIHVIFFSLLSLWAFPVYGVVAVDRAEQNAAMQKGERQDARVRVKMVFKPYQKIAVRQTNGFVNFSFKPAAKSTHTLRIFMDSSNHLYVDQWHIESHPLSWVADKREFSVRFTIYKVFGKRKDVEEKVGDMTVRGMLAESDQPYIFNLIAQEQAFFKSAQGDPQLELTAGFKLEDFSRKSLAKAQGQTSPGR